MPLLWKESRRTKGLGVPVEIKRPFLPYVQETVASGNDLADLQRDSTLPIASEPAAGHIEAIDPVPDSQRLVTKMESSRLRQLFMRVVLRR